MEYFYPEDVIVITHADGKRVAKLGYEVRLTREGDTWGICFTSSMPAVMDMHTVIDAFHREWLKGREKHRKITIDAWLSDREKKLAYWGEVWAKLLAENNGDVAATIEAYKATACTMRSK